TREVFAIRSCPGCGLGHTTPQPDDIAEYYGADYYGQRHGVTYRWCLWRRLGILARASKRGTGRLLDVGCGDGGFLDVARARGWEVVGTELGGNASRTAARGIEVQPSIAGATERGARTFHVATMWHSL